jgi:hypothetical protein
MMGVAGARRRHGPAPTSATQSCPSWPGETQRGFKRASGTATAARLGIGSPSARLDSHVGSGWSLTGGQQHGQHLSWWPRARLRYRRRVYAQVPLRRLAIATTSPISFKMDGRRSRLILRKRWNSSNTFRKPYSLTRYASETRSSAD